ncbi:hypothetical protein XENOCAPTIV_027482, partial [Xenoophorus captivus]
VGSAFTKPTAKQELDTIASKPAGNFVFQVGSFDALNKIQESLQAKIFSIEGSQTSGEALKQEMSQEGFRAAYVSGEIQMTMVGANQWKGGYKKYSLSSAQTTGSFEPSFMETDSYLGKNMLKTDLLDSVSALFEFGSTKRISGPRGLLCLSVRKTHVIP